MNAFTQLLILFALLASLLSQEYVAAMPTAFESHTTQSVQPPRVRTHIERDSPGYTIVHDGRPKYVQPVTHTASPYPAATESIAPLTGKAVGQDEAADGTDGLFAKMQPAAIIALFTLTPFAACILFYPIFRWLRQRRETGRLSKQEALAKKGATSPYLNNPRLTPLPVYPQMVYVTPTSKDGTRPIFGHIRSPSGNHVFGVADRWVIAEEGTEENVKMNKSKECLLVREV